MSSWRENILVCCINQYPQKRSNLVGLNFKETHYHWGLATQTIGLLSPTELWFITVEPFYNHKSSLRFWSIEFLIVVRSLNLVHLRKKKSTFLSPSLIRSFISSQSCLNFKNGLALSDGKIWNFFNKFLNLMI